MATQFIQANPRVTTADRMGRAFSNLGQSLGQSYAQHQLNQEQQRLQQEQSRQQSQQLQQLTGMDLSGLSPEMQSKAMEIALRGQQEEKKFAFQREQEERKGNLGAQKEFAKDQEEFSNLQGALDTVNQMRSLRSKGNLGVISKAHGFFDPEVRQDRGQYEQLGKSLIQYATNIPIRNKLEFETLSEKLYDPSLTDAEAEGVLNAMEKIITDSMQSKASKYGGSSKPENQETESKKERPDLKGIWK